MGDFDSIKIGVCDAYWTEKGGSEVFLGLTKGGCELTYTPEWYDLQTDRYGKSPTDSALVGESVSVKIPLAETDMSKIEMFAHTSVKILGSDDTSKLTFGRFPGFRLGNKAGRLRLHPVAMAKDRSEDVVIYKSVNKAPLNLNYKLDEERIFSTEFIGMIKRDHLSGAMLWEIGDSTMGDESITLSATLDSNGLPTNLLEMVLASGGNMWLTPANVDVQTSSDADLAVAIFKAYVEFGGRVYNVTKKVGFELTIDGGAQTNGVPIIKGAPSSAPVYPYCQMSASEWGAISASSSTGRFAVDAWADISALEPYMLKAPDLDASSITNWRAMTYGDVAEITISATWGDLTAIATVDAEVTA